MQRLHGVYAQYFNRRHGRSGHLFQGRFGTTVMRSDAPLLLGYFGADGGDPLDRYVDFVA
jgi:hypothetical protein